MAEGDSTPEFPSSVVFDDDQPKKGFASVQLKVPNLQTKRKFGILEKQPTNADVQGNFDSKSIEVTVKLNINGEEIKYEYKKNAPQDIDPEHCKIQCKDNYVIVILAKEVKGESWVKYKDYMIEKPK